MRERERKKKNTEKHIATGKLHHVENGDGTKKDALPFCAAFPELMRNTGHEAF